MTITLHSTTKIVEVNGVPVRIWEGETAAGIPVVCFVALIRAASDADLAEFERDLAEQRPPSETAAAIPLRLIL